MDDQEYVSLPDLNDNQTDEYNYGGDETLWANDPVIDASEDLEPLVKDTTPFYANQLDNPDVAAADAEFWNSLGH